MHLDELKEILSFSARKDSKEKITMAKWIIYMAMFFLALYGGKAYFQGLVTYATAHYIILAISLFNYLIYLRTNNLNVLVWHINIFFSIFLCYMVFTGGTGRDTGLIWFQIFPLLTFIINGLSIGILMSLLYIIIAIIATVFTDLPFVTHNYPQNVIYSFYGTFLFITVSSFVLELSLVLSHMKEEEYRQQLLSLSQKDELTDIYNRRYMNEKLHSLFENKAIFSLAFIDIDNFKVINDTYGHDFGDLVLQQVADIFKNNLREEDFLARWGGEEFLIIFNNISKDNAYSICERIREQTETTPIKHENTFVYVTLSFGIENSNDCSNQDELIFKADNKLYEAKNTGKNKIIF